MHEKAADNGSSYREASSLLAAALAQLDKIKQAIALVPGSNLDSLAGPAREVVLSIRSAMASGNLDATALASLSAGLNLGVDVSALVAESVGADRAMAAKIAVAGAAVESRATVERLSDEMYRKHLFDADVEHHTQGPELGAFRRRQAEDEKYVREQLGRRTAEGDLNASGRMEGSMLDANAHGAGDNREFINKWNDLKLKTEHLRDSMRAASMSTEEYDKQIKQDVADFLKTKGVSDAQITEALAKNENPLDAVQVYLGADNQSQRLVTSLRDASRAEEVGTRTTISTPDKEPALTIDMDVMNARLAAAGLDGGSASEITGHGLSIQKPRNIVIEH